MGPVTWALEYALDKTKFYCGKKNADDYSKIYTEMMNKNKKVVEGDGSGFDQTQHVELKYIDRLIYNYIKPKVWHVNQNTFINVCVTPIKTLRGDYFSNQKKKRNIVAGQLNGTVFSGSSDTTLMNTIRMSTYNIFTLYKAGLFHFEHDYQGLHKGDDFVEFVDKNIDNQTIINTYNKYWAKKNEKKYSKGIGQIIKIIECLPIERSSFCSCIVIKDKIKNKLYFVRDPKRMVRFAAFARKTAFYSSGLMHNYLEDQAVALEQAGLKNVPFYKTFIQAYRNEKKRYDNIGRINVEGPQKTTRLPNEPERLCSNYTYKRNDKNKVITVDHPLKGKIETHKIDGKKYIIVETQGYVEKTSHKWLDDNTVKYDMYLHDRDYYYGRIKNDRLEQIQIDEEDFYDQLNKRYTNDKCNWSKTNVKKFEQFLLNPTSKLKYDQYTLLDEGSYNEDVV
jgi:hypothetical protein